MSNTRETRYQSSLPATHESKQRGNLEGEDVRVIADLVRVQCEVGSQQAAGVGVVVVLHFIHVVRRVPDLHVYAAVGHGLPLDALPPEEPRLLSFFFFSSYLPCDGSVTGSLCIWAFSFFFCLPLPASADVNTRYHHHNQDYQQDQGHNDSYAP